MGAELTAALEKLAQLMSVKAAEGLPPASGAIVVPHADQVFKLELMPNDVKLNGVSSYLSWSRRALLILKTKGLTEYVLGTVEEPADKASPEWKKWSVTDSLILAWMLNSLIPAIAMSVEHVLQFLMDDVSDFLSTHFSSSGDGSQTEEKGCTATLKAFIDYISLRETENFRSRKEENKNSITLTTIHQSKGLEWDVVFIVQANDSEIPLLHEYNGSVKEAGCTLEEERRLFYVAMTRARKKLYILHVTVDSHRQLLPPSRFLREIPGHLLDIQGEGAATKYHEQPSGDISFDHAEGETSTEKPIVNQNETSPYPELMQSCLANDFLKRFEIDDRAVVSHVFHHWAKRQAFQISKRLLDKVKFVIDERLRGKGYKRKDVLCKLKSLLSDDGALGYAEYVIKWEQIPIDKRSHLMRERQEHFQKQRIENSMGFSEPTPKQISYLRSLGCTITPTSRLHASNLIEKYKSL